MSRRHRRLPLGVALQEGLRTPDRVVTTPSPAPPVVVECWCGLVERTDRRALDRFTRDIWKRFDHRDLEPLKWAIIRRRRLPSRSSCARRRASSQPSINGWSS